MIAAAALPGKADTLQTFDLTYSGASFGNSASATGQVVLDLSTLPNPGVYEGLDIIHSLTLTVTGASAGNGTFTLADFSDANWDTAGSTLDLNRELVGQATEGSTWGTPDGTGGDFRLFSYGSSAPIGTDFFTLQTNSDGEGDEILLTSFAPDDAGSATPEPGTSALLMLAAATLLGFSARLRLSHS